MRSPRARLLLAVGLFAAGILVPFVAAGGSSAEQASAAGLPAAASPVGLWRWQGHSIYYRVIRTSTGYRELSMTTYPLKNGCVVRAGEAVASYSRIRNKPDLYRTTYRQYPVDPGGPGEDGSNCGRVWGTPVTVRLAVRGNVMTESCNNRPAKVCYRYVRVSSVPTVTGPGATTTTSTAPPPTTPTPTTTAPTPPTDTWTRVVAGKSATTQCGTGDDAKRVFFQGDSSTSRKQHYLDPGTTILLPIELEGGSGGLMEWFFNDGRGTLYVSGCLLRYEAATSATCSQCSPSISVFFANRAGRDYQNFYARLNVTVIYSQPPSLCGREYLQVSVNGAYTIQNPGLGLGPYGPFFQPITFQPIATGTWIVAYNGRTRTATVPSCSGAKVIDG